MRLHRFYFDTPISPISNIHLTDIELIKQVTKVLRKKVGDSIILFDGSGSDFLCKILDIKKDNISLSAVEVTKSKYIPFKKINIFISIIKRDKFEWLVEKTTELGISNIIPIISDRSEKKDLNIKRLRKIAIEASEQSGRANIPNISEIIDFDTALLSHISFILHPDAKKLDMKSTEDNDSLSIMIGPEGGWSPEEMNKIRQNEIPYFSLGSQILKTETASVAISSLLLI